MHIFIQWLALGFLALVLITPVIAFLRNTWKRRKDEIDRVRKGELIREYYSVFFPNKLPMKDSDLKKDFDDKFKRESGWQTYVFPLVLLFTSCLLSVPVGLIIVENLLHGTSASISLERSIVISAFSGAYIYVCMDLIRRSRSGFLFPVHIYEGTLRLMISIAIGFALIHLQDIKSIPVIAFVLCSFPTKDLLGLLRSYTAKQLNVDFKAPSNADSVKEIQGIDDTIAERLSDDGITSIMQLAYADPILLTFRSGYSLPMILDWMSQSLAWIYLDKHLPWARIYGIRGALEIEGFFGEQGRKKSQQVTDQILTQITESIKKEGVEMSKDLLQYKFESVLDDSNYAFIAGLYWITSNEE